jgi:hypothetical protein
VTGAWRFVQGYPVYGEDPLWLALQGGVPRRPVRARHLNSSEQHAVEVRPLDVNILLRIKRGDSNAQIAAALGVSELELVRRLELVARKLAVAAAAQSVLAAADRAVFSKPIATFAVDNLPPRQRKRRGSDPDRDGRAATPGLRSNEQGDHVRAPE